MALCLKRSSKLFSTQNPMFCNNRIVNYIPLKQTGGNVQPNIKLLHNFSAYNTIIYTASVAPQTHVLDKKSYAPLQPKSVKSLWNISEFRLDVRSNAKNGRDEKWYSTNPQCEIEIEADLDTDDKDSGNIKPPSKEERKRQTQLTEIYFHMRKILPLFFDKGHTFHHYHEDMICENQFDAKTIYGLRNYKMYLFWIRTKAFVRYTWIKFYIVKITKDHETSTVKVRWTVKGITLSKVILNLWTYGFKMKEMADKVGTTYDGFSTFYVGNDGKIHKHVISKMMPDEEREIVSTIPLKAAKLALLGIIPTCLDTFSSSM